MEMFGKYGNILKYATSNSYRQYREEKVQKRNELKNEMSNEIADKFSQNPTAFNGLSEERKEYYKKQAIKIVSNAKKNYEARGKDANKSGNLVAKLESGINKSMKKKVEIIRREEKILEKSTSTAAKILLKNERMKHLNEDHVKNKLADFINLEFGTDSKKRLTFSNVEFDTCQGLQDPNYEKSLNDAIKISLIDFTDKTATKITDIFNTRFSFLARKNNIDINQCLNILSDIELELRNHKKIMESTFTELYAKNDIENCKLINHHQTNLSKLYEEMLSSISQKAKKDLRSEEFDRDFYTNNSMSLILEDSDDEPEYIKQQRIALEKFKTENETAKKNKKIDSSSSSQAGNLERQNSVKQNDLISKKFQSAPEQQKYWKEMFFNRIINTDPTVKERKSIFDIEEINEVFSEEGDPDKDEFNASKVNVQDSFFSDQNQKLITN